MRLLTIIIFIVILLPMASGLAQTPQSAILGKLIPAVVKCFGKRISGVNMNKVIHIINKAQHGLQALDPAEIVYEVVHVVASQMPATKFVQIVLTSGKIIQLVIQVGLSGGGVGLGTGYVISKVSEGIERVC